MLVIAIYLAAIGFVHSMVSGVDILAISEIWPFILLSFMGQLLYGSCLAATLKRGDLSVYYPIIRASPIFIVSYSFLFLGKRYDLILLLGIAMVLTGVFLLLYRRNSALLNDPVAFLLAVVAMCGTGIYSLADALIVQSVAPQVLFFWVEILLIPAYLILYRVTGKAVPRYCGLSRIIERPFFYSLIGGMVYSSYFLILYAYELGGEVAAVTSIRQASIPLSVIIGGYFLREGAILRRLFAALILSYGIVVIISSQ